MYCCHPSGSLSEKSSSGAYPPAFPAPLAVKVPSAPRRPCSARKIISSAPRVIPRGILKNASMRFPSARDAHARVWHPAALKRPFVVDAPSGQKNTRRFPCPSKNSRAYKPPRAHRSSASTGPSAVSCTFAQITPGAVHGPAYSRGVCRGTFPGSPAGLACSCAARIAFAGFAARGSASRSSFFITALRPLIKSLQG